jgi:ATP-dependent Lhr-like helicase
MSADLFHPIVDAWFRERFGAATDPQRLGWPEIAAGRHTLIAAPTGSGKTLAAFLVCIDRLVRQGLTGELPDETQVLYISPLKALSNDIQRNLLGPLDEVTEAAVKAGLRLPPIRAKVRTGDTPAYERAKMLKTPPHILVTTPESLYLLVTSAKSREKLRSVTTVIVDEIHAMARDKRGSHLTITLERLAALCKTPPTRIGLSATQKPIEDIAHFLVGAGKDGAPLDCKIVDTGHLRQLDLAIEVPDSDLAAVCSNEQWDEVYKKLVHLITTHRSTLVFVNTRRMSERLSHRLREYLGEEAVASHHGSLSRASRLATEERFKKGELKVVVATASLELGIDIGFIDLVCQIGSPRSIATFLQRVGRSGHRLGVIPRGRLVALTRDEAIESMALIRAVHQGRLDTGEMPLAPLDILAQQIVAEVACIDWDENALYHMFRKAWPYRDLARVDFDRILTMVSEGIAPGRHEGAYIHRDRLNHQLRARRSARLTALTSGGAIPETADYRVVTEGENTFVGTVNEDFAIESLAGDVFLLGNTSWRIRYVRGGQVVVNDAEGAPANVPFWLGEAPGRTVELSDEVSRLREEIAARLGTESDDAISAWLQKDCGVDDRVARQAMLYVAAQKAAVGFVPTQKRILFERFFDDAGGMQLVIHAPFGSRINRAWGLAQRKRFCRTFDFELQASADDNGIVLSLGPQHSFSLDQMFKMLQSHDARETLVQALLAAPMFQVRWRWNLTRSLAVLRNRGGKKVPPPLQRFKSDDLMTAVFPLQTACFEHRPPEVPIPDHPLIAQTLFDCLHEAMDVVRWEQVLKDIESGEIKLEARDTREPSPFSHSILNANAYSFLDDAPLEERRARAVALRRTLSVDDMKDLAQLDPEAIARVEAEAWPIVRDAEELHDVLQSTVALPETEGEAWREWFTPLLETSRACLVRRPEGPTLWIAAERTTLVKTIFPDAAITPAVELPEDLLVVPEKSVALVALLRGRMDIQGPVTAQRVAHDLGLPIDEAVGALQRLEVEGAVMQGRYTERAWLDIPSTAPAAEWCERRLLARIHRLTLDGARKRVQAVTPDVYWRFLADYHHLTSSNQRDGPLGLHEAIGQLQGFEIPAGAWEIDVLPGRMETYQPEWVDQLSYSGELAWGRLKPPLKPEEAEPTRGGLTRVVPIALAFREDLPWLLPPALGTEDQPPHARADAAAVYQMLQRHGALFFHDLQRMTGLLTAQLEDALSELAALGAVTADGFSAIRGLVRTRQAKQAMSRWRRPAARHAASASVGRWTLFPGFIVRAEKEARLIAWAWQLLRRYGVVFRDLLARESVAPSWWELTPIFRRLEMRGEIRGGRFVSQVAGEQYAVPEAIELLRRPPDPVHEWLVISAADPLNLAGIITAGPRVPATRGNRLLLRNGRLAAVHQGGETQIFEDSSEALKIKIARLLQLQVLPLRGGLLKELSDSTPIA